MAHSLSRRTLFEIGTVGLAGVALTPAASGAPSSDGMTSETEAVIRSWFKLWGTSRTWAPFDALMADDFTFSSPNHDDHISKTAFKSRCWEPNINLTQALDIELLIARGDQAFVKYLGRTTTGKTFRNVELHQVRNRQVASIECYFGGNMSFPAGVEAQKS
ncbi:MAG TPA: nuclear transport factor 2 family protein [Steroidobacteraceae bacterium]|nr:nuclear transport factor 2 family protein [Steroidobacteraceae bacterium]